MSDITDAGPRLRLLNEALEEHDRLRAQIEEKNDEIARLLITDEERSALKWFARCGQPKHHAAALARLLERTANRDTTPPTQSTPAECSVPPEWTSKPYWVDPPSGWAYGFPKVYDPSQDGNITEWMIRNGYPEQLARQGLPYTATACTDNGEK